MKIQNQECKEQVSRDGNSTKSYNTTNLSYHLSQVHPALHVQYQAEIASKEGCKEKLRSSSATSKRQATLADCRKLDISDPWAQLIHTRMGNDGHRFPTLFHCWGRWLHKTLHTLESRYAIPSRKYFTETVLPSIFNKTKKKVEVSIKGVSHNSNFSFTTDLWSSTSINSLMSLTAH